MLPQKSQKLLFEFHLLQLCKPEELENRKRLNSIMFTQLWDNNHTVKGAKTNLVNTPILDAIDNLWGILFVPSFRCPKDGSTTFVDVIDNLWCQWNRISRVEASKTSLNLKVEYYVTLSKKCSFLQNKIKTQEVIPLYPELCSPHTYDLSRKLFLWLLYWHQDINHHMWQYKHTHPLIQNTPGKTSNHFHISISVI